MILFAEREYRFLGLERRVVQYVLFAAVVVLFLFMSLGRQQGWFEKTVHPYFTADTASGLSRGMAVKFKGFKIGNIQDIAIGDDLKVRVTLSIQDKYIKFLNSSSWPRLTKEGVIGDSVLEIEPGRQAGQPVQDGTRLGHYARADSVEQVADLIKKEVVPVVEELHRMTQHMSDPGSDVNKTLRNVSQASANLLAMEREIDLLARNSDTAVNNINGKMSRVLDRADAGVAMMNQTMPKLLHKADTSMAHVEATSEDVRTMVHAAHDQVPDLLRNGQVMLDNTNDVLSSAKKTWPIKSMLTPERETLLPVDSYDARQP